MGWWFWRMPGDDLQYFWAKFEASSSQYSALLLQVILEYKQWYFSKLITLFHSVQFSSVAQLCLTPCNPMDCSMPGFPVHHQLPKFAQTHVHRVSDAIQPCHPLSSPSPPAFNLSQHQGLFQWVSSSHQVAKVLELQLQHQSFQRIFGTDFLYDWRVWSPCSPVSD